MRSREQRQLAAGEPSDPRPLRARDHVKLATVLVLLGTLVASLGLTAAPAMAEFGIAKFAFSARNQNGTPDVQAGSHPYALTTTLEFGDYGPTKGQVKDVTLELPPGLVGNPDATPKCAYEEFIKEVKTGATESECPTETAVGVATFYLHRPETSAGTESAAVAISSSPVFNLAPPPGYAAEFGYVAAETAPVLLLESVRTGKDYGVNTLAPNVDALNILASKVTLWGIPAALSHNPWRGSCEESFAGVDAIEPTGQGLAEGEDELEGPLALPGGFRNTEQLGMPESRGECVDNQPAKPLLTLPTSCSRTLTATASVDSWQEPGDFVGAEGQRTKIVSLPEMTGCNKLSFDPKVSVKPEQRSASSPSGVNVGVTVPQDGTEDPNGLADADVKDGTLVFPAGVQLNASAAGGLEGCSIAQVGYTGTKELEPGTEPGVRTPQFEERVENPETGKQEADACPNASKVANVKIKSPLLEGELTGGVYLAAPQNFMTGVQENPFSSLTAFYGIVEEPKTGVIVKFPGNLLRNEATGQLTATIENTPQLPFDELHMEFFGGERASFVTPADCGGYQAVASVTPWSGGEVAKPNSEFAVTSGPGGSACPSGALPFTPSLQAGTTSLNAGGYAPLSTVISRGDGQQAIKGVTLTYPPGVSAVLTGVPECGEAQANAGTCGAESLIGEDTASVGVGSEPYTVTGGKVYLTGPYDGAPFGLSIVTPTQAGPFVLEEGRPVVTRAKIEINPTTAQVTVTTTSEIPHILDGFELNVKTIDVTIGRSGFALNPTSCDPMSVTGSIAGLEGTSFGVSTPFQVANCANLKFEPEVSISTAAQASKADGAPLTFKIAYPKGALGSQAWFKEAKLDIPKQLPARLTTIQQACLAATFEANPASCPAHSKIGEAVVHTEVLPEPLKGPVYFVSYGSAKFPDAVMVLTGDNVTVRLTGETFIDSKTGVTSATFPDTPDVPFENIEVTLPTGEYSEFGANLGEGKYDFCGQKLTVPTEFKAQNGLEIHEETPVTITGCTPAIAVVSHKVKGRIATLVVSVPSPGKLTATGKGLSKGTVKAAKAGDVTVKVALTKAETARLSKHKGRKLKATVRLQFAAKTGSSLSTTTTVVLG
jgi:hypothetical protein